MKKGDLKKREIIKTAETLFCRNGYETTSVQDILDILHTSKGSFYHHFASKELLLEKICRERANVVAGKVNETIREDEDPLININKVFSGMMPLTGEKLSFLMMILPVFDLPEGRQIRYGYAESLESAFMDTAIREIRRGNEKEEFYCCDPGHSANICFILLNELWYRICLTILKNEKSGKDTDPTVLLGQIDNFRATIERLLSAPYGSIKLMNLDDVKFLADQIHYHWKLHHFGGQ